MADDSSNIYLTRMKIPMVAWGAIGAVVLLLVIGSSFLFTTGDCRNFKASQLLVNGQAWSVALAVTDAEKLSGLSGCKRVPTQSGMYFPFTPAVMPSFWMRGMVIPIDIIWIRDGKVIWVNSNLPPVDKYATDPPQYTPPQPVTGVLEVGAGQAAAQGIKVGSTITPLR